MQVTKEETEDKEAYLAKVNAEIEKILQLKQR